MALFFLFCFSFSFKTFSILDRSGVVSVHYTVCRTSGALLHWICEQLDSSDEQAAAIRRELDGRLQKVAEMEKVCA